MPEPITLRLPIDTDGKRVFDLVMECPPLDVNSAYCNLLQCTHFAQTSVTATQGHHTVGFISGYIIPERPDTLFIWQVAVAESARGQGLANQMLTHILDRPATTDVRFLETTITESNKASWALFQRFADQQGAPLESNVMFDETQHFQGDHASEMLVRIGPM